MKKLNLIIKGLSILGGISAYSDLIPAKFLPVALLTFALSSILKDAVIVVGDYMDDKILNQSFNPDKPTEL